MRPIALIGVRGWMELGACGWMEVGARGWMELGARSMLNAYEAPVPAGASVPAR